MSAVQYANAPEAMLLTEEGMNILSPVQPEKALAPMEESFAFSAKATVTGVFLKQ